MDPKKPDPNNHVPEVTPDDDWGDLELTEEERKAASKALPKRRNDELRRPRKRDVEEEPEVYRVIPDDDEDEAPVVIQRLELEEGAKPAKRKRRPVLVEGEDEESAVRKIEPSGQAANKPAEKVTRSEDDKWGEANPHSIRWMIFSGLGIVVLLIAAIAVRPLLVEKSGVKNVPDFEGVVTQKPDLSYDPAEFDMGGDTQTLAQAMMQHYANAKTVDEILPMIRDRDRLEETVRKEWKPFWTEGKWTLPDKSEWTIRKVEDRDFACLSGPMPDFTPFQFYFLRVNGELLIDWEASTGRCDASFEELASGKGGGLVRVAVSVNDMYSFAFPDEQYQNLRMVCADSETVLWGYVKKRSEIEDRMKPLFQPGLITKEMGYEYRVTLRLEPSPPDALPNQWIIAEMLHIDWLTP